MSGINRNISDVTKEIRDSFLDFEEYKRLTDILKETTLGIINVSREIKDSKNPLPGEQLRLLRALVEHIQDS